MNAFISPYRADRVCEVQLEDVRDGDTTVEPVGSGRSAPRTPAQVSHDKPSSSVSESLRGSVVGARLPGAGQHAAGRRTGS